jgi:hypothetical protein
MNMFARNAVLNSNVDSHMNMRMMELPVRHAKAPIRKGHYQGFSLGMNLVLYQRIVLVAAIVLVVPAARAIINKY